MPSSSTDRFVTAWRDWQAAPRHGPEVMEQRLEELLTLYREPHRHYHGISHIADLLERAEGRRFRDREVMMAAIFYHDAIYDIAGKDNEERSAQLAVPALRSLAYTQDFVEKVAGIIRATAHHERTRDLDTDRFLDLDMAILADPPERYAIYRQAIMDEYRTVHSSEAYRTGRIALFIEPMLAREAIFVSGAFSELEAQARRNVEAEREWLLGL